MPHRQPRPRASASWPLDGVRVLSVEVMQSLPYATQLLGRLGAEIIKVEVPDTGDTARRARPFVEDVDGSSVGATFLRTNIGKKSVAIDLRSPEGHELFMRSATPRGRGGREPA